MRFLVGPLAPQGGAMTQQSVPAIRFGASWSTQFRFTQAIGRGLAELKRVDATVHVLGPGGMGALAAGRIDVVFSKWVVNEHRYSGTGIYAGETSRTTGCGPSRGSRRKTASSSRWRRGPASSRSSSSWQRSPRCTWPAAAPTSSSGSTASPTPTSRSGAARWGGWSIRRVTRRRATTPDSSTRSGATAAPTTSPPGPGSARADTAS